MYNVEQLPQTKSIAPWYSNICQFLEHDTLPMRLLNKQKREIRLKYLYYQLIHRIIFRKHHKNVLLIFLAS